MLNFGRCFVFFVFLLILGCTEANTIHDWKTSCPENVFCFQHPAQFIAEPVQSIDSITGKLTNGEISLVYDFGSYASQYQQLTEASHDSIIIDGYNGKIIMTPHLIALVIPQISGKLKFSMAFEYPNGIHSVQRKEAKKIFKTIKFNTI